MSPDHYGAGSSSVGESSAVWNRVPVGPESKASTSMVPVRSVSNDCGRYDDAVTDHDTEGESNPWRSPFEAADGATAPVGQAPGTPAWAAAGPGRVWRFRRPALTRSRVPGPRRGCRDRRSRRGRARPRRRGEGLQPARNRRGQPRPPGGRSTAQAGPQARRPAGRCPGRRRPREPVASAARRPGGPLALRTSTVAREIPGWLLSIPTPSASSGSSTGPCSAGATSERLFGVSKARAATLRSSAANQRRSRARSSCSSSRSTSAGPRSASGRERRRVLGRGAPAGPADRGPVQGARRNHEREAADLTNGGCRSNAGGSRCGSTGRRTP